jgi:DNA invertase Pin-like site-specific DNA recombinase
MRPKNSTPGIAYLRTSSAANVGAEKDSDKRQRLAIEAFAKHAGYEIVGEYFDAAVSGADPIDGRPGFKALLERIVSNGVNTVIVEDASRFARTLMVQEAGIAMLVGLGVRVMTSRGDDLTDSDDEMRVAMRQIVGVFSLLEKTRLVKKLKAARERKKASGKGRYTGRKSHVEKRPDVVAEAKRLYRVNPKTGERRSLREISAELEFAGFLNEFGKPYHPQSIQRMIEGERPPRELRDREK